MTAASTSPVRTSGAGSWLRWSVAIVFGLLYAYFIWTAIAALILAASGDPGLNGAGWAVFLLPVLFPALVYVGSFLFSRRRRVWQLALVFLAGLLLTAVFWLNIVTYQITSGSLLLAS